jgi:putative ABC transport system permease protein
VRRADGSSDPDAAELVAGHHYVTPAYFATLGIPLLRGRVFAAADRVGRPSVAVVSAGAARRFWPGEDPIGKRFFLGMREDAPADSALEIVGIVGDVRYRPAGHRIEPDIYTPYYQFASNVWALLMVRSPTPSARLVPALREAVSAVDRNLPIDDVRTMEERGGRTLARRRLHAALLTVFAALALTIATVGVYGVVSHQSAERAREFGIRIAVGAAARDVLGLVLRRALVLIGTGLVLGVLAAVALTRLLRAQLVDVAPTDPATFAAISGALALATLAASYPPARRACSVEPFAALRLD